MFILTCVIADPTNHHPVHQTLGTVTKNLLWNYDELEGLFVSLNTGIGKLFL